MSYIHYICHIENYKTVFQTDSAFCNIDPYAIISLGAAEQQTSVASGTSPTWDNESMEFPVEVPDSEELQLLLKVGQELRQT